MREEGIRKESTEKKGRKKARTRKFGKKKRSVKRKTTLFLRERGGEERNSNGHVSTSQK